MLKDITLGQYFPGKTVIHRMDPRFKLICVFLYIVAIFFASGVFSYVLSAAFLAAAVLISRISFRTILKSVKPVLLIVVFTAILNIFYTSGGNTLAEFWIFRISDAGIYTAIRMSARILLLILSTSLLTYTTSPIALTDAIESLMKPLKKIRFPVHELAMMMTIALRFIPTLIEETDKIMNAQKARGADFDSGNLIRRVKALIPLLVPLFISAFRRADELAIAMEARCYRGDVGRTRMKQLKAVASDYAATGITVAVATGMAVLGLMNL